MSFRSSLVSHLERRVSAENDPEIMKSRADILCTIQLGSISSLRCQKSRTLLSIQTSRCEVMFRGRRLNTCKHSVGDQTIWWSQTGSNRRPHACKARALPAELWPRTRRRMPFALAFAGATAQQPSFKKGLPSRSCTAAKAGGPGKT